jgi:hypothetical protein
MKNSDLISLCQLLNLCHLLRFNFTTSLKFIFMNFSWNIFIYILFPKKHLKTKSTPDFRKVFEIKKTK